MPSVVEERSYLGENWDYVVRPEDARHSLRVSALPSGLHDVGAQVLLEFDPWGMVVF